MSGGARRSSAFALGLALALIAAATLLPLQDAQPPGARKYWWHPALGDVLRNILLFTPLGAALAVRGSSAARSAGLAAGISIAIELAQLGIPGRYANPWDVAADALGALLGVAALRSHAYWRAPPPARAARLAWGAAAAIALAALGSAALRAPAAEGGRLTSRWPPSAYLRVYGGELDAVDLRGRPLPQGPVADAAGTRAELSGDFDLHLRGRAGPAPGAAAGLFALTDAAGRDVLLLAVAGDDLLLRVRDRARSLGLESPFLRGAGLFADLRPGAPFDLEVERRGPAYCMRQAGRERCGLGFTAGDGWTLLVPFVSPVPALAVLWIGGLFALLGYWLRRGPAGALTLLLACAALLGAPRLGALLPTPPAQGLAAAAGTALGAALARCPARAGAAQPPRRLPTR